MKEVSADHIDVDPDMQNCQIGGSHPSNSQYIALSFSLQRDCFRQNSEENNPITRKYPHNLKC